MLFRSVRGLGLLLGLEVAGSAPAYAEEARAKGLLLNAVNETTLRLAPPLTISDEELGEALSILRAVLAG